MAGARAKAAASGSTDVAAAAKVALAAAAARKAAKPAPAEPLSAADRENPDKLSGDALRELAYRRGVSRSEAKSMSDDNLRMQLRYITNRQYAEEG